MTAPQLTVQVQGNGAVNADYLNGINQTCDVPADLRAFTGVTGMQVYMRGYTSPGDGGQGEFYWNASSTAADDGGVTTIAPSGATQGRWIRLPAATSTTTYNYAPDTGTTNALVATISPAPGSLTAGISVFVKVANTNSGATTLNLNGLGAKAIQYGGASMPSGYLVAGQVYLFVYDGTQFELQSVISPANLAAAVTSYLVFTNNPYVVDTGIANAIVVTLSPAPSSYTAGLSANVKVAANNTGATTINFNGLGAKAITYQGAALTSGQLVAGQIYGVQYDGTQFQLLTGVGNPSGWTQNFSTTGWTKGSNGFLIQWAPVTLNAGGSTTVSWPISFPTACTFATCRNLDEGGSPGTQNNPAQFDTYNQTGGLIQNAGNGTSGTIFGVGY